MFLHVMLIKQSYCTG